MSGITLWTLLDRKQVIEESLQEKHDILYLKKKSNLTWPLDIKVPSYDLGEIYTPPPTRKSTAQSHLLRQVKQWDAQQRKDPNIPRSANFKRNIYNSSKDDIATYLSTVLETDDETKISVTRDLCLQMVDKVSANILNTVPFRKKRKVLGWEYMLMQISQLDLPRNVVNRVKKRMEAVTGQKAKADFVEEEDEPLSDLTRSETEIKSSARLKRRHSEDMDWFEDDRQPLKKPRV